MKVNMTQNQLNEYQHLADDREEVERMIQPCLYTDWIEQSVPIVLAWFKPGMELTADDLHGVVDEPMHPNQWGGLIHALKPHLELVGYCRSTRPDRNGGLIRRWRVKP
jgi:hypothetical protein